MVYVGLDISIESPAICVNKNNELFFVGYIREGVKLTKSLKNQIDFLNNLKNVSINFLKEKETDIRYSSQENLDLIDGINNMRGIVSEIKKFTNEDILVGIEGFSFGSTGSSHSKLYGYQYLLRYFLHELEIPWGIYAPTTVKKTAGNGRFKKEQLIESFLNNSKNINTLINNDFRQSILDNINMVKPNSKYLKPFEDLIDAYWVMETIKQANKQNKI